MIALLRALLTHTRLSVADYWLTYHCRPLTARQINDRTRRLGEDLWTR